MVRITKLSIGSPIMATCNKYNVAYLEKSGISNVIMSRKIQEATKTIGIGNHCLIFDLLTFRLLFGISMFLRTKYRAIDNNSDSHMYSPRNRKSNASVKVKIIY